jgi:hypothetical protein
VAADLFEGHELARIASDDPRLARETLDLMIRRPRVAERAGGHAREQAIELFGIETVGPQWREFLG